MSDLFTNPTVVEAIDVMVRATPLAIWETFYSTVLSTLFAYVIGLPLGVLLVVGEKNGILPIPKAVLSLLNVIVNLLRSVPFLI